MDLFTTIKHFLWYLKFYLKLLKRNIPEHLNCNSQSSFDQEALRHVWCFWWTLVENPRPGSLGPTLYRTAASLQATAAKSWLHQVLFNSKLCFDFAQLLNQWINSHFHFCILGCLLFKSTENVQKMLWWFFKSFHWPEANFHESETWL